MATTTATTSCLWMAPALVVAIGDLAADRRGEGLLPGVPPQGSSPQAMRAEAVVAVEDLWG